MSGPLILGTNAVTGGYEVANSLRFDDGSSDYLSQTFSGAGNQRTFTISFWFKRSNLVNGNVYTYQGEGNEIRSEFIFFNDYLKIVFNPTGSAWSSDMIIQNNGSNILFRDVSAWYHVVLAIDTTQSTEANRIKPYVNGVLQSMSAYPSQNFDTGYNTAIEHGIGTYIHATNTFFDGYFAEFCVVDGLQLDATSFGEFDSDSPTIWKPKNVSGLTFGTNGFHLDFENSSSLGADVSGNSNNFTVNNLTAIDQTTDTCTNNFSTMNPLDNYYFGGTFSEGNLKVATIAGVEGYLTNTMPVSTGKWYWEMKITSSGSNRDQIGIADKVIDNTDFSPISGNPRYEGYYGYTGNHYSSDTGNVSYGATFTTGDIVGVALDLVNHKLYFHKNGTYQNSGDPTSGSTGTGAIAVETDPHDGVYYATFANIHNTASTFEANFGNPVFTISSGNSDANGHGNFEYAVPSGYFALCTKNLAEFG